MKIFNIPDITTDGSYTLGAVVTAILLTHHQPAYVTLPLVILAGLGIAVSLILHLVFIGMSAKLLGRSPVLWVLICLCLLPVASIAGLILFEWFSDQENQASV